MKTAHEFVSSGVEFSYENGSLCCVSPDDVTPELIEEVARRTEIMVSKIPDVGIIPVITIADFEEKRWGACMTCGDPMSGSVGGMCPLCILALRKALQQVGRFAEKAAPEETARVEKLQETIVQTTTPKITTPKVTTPQTTRAASVAPEPPSETHRCHALGCKRIIPPRYLMCFEHWKMVPYSMQKKVWDTYVEGQEIRKDPTDEYLDVQAVVVRYVAQKEGKLPGDDAVAIPDNEYFVYIESIQKRNKSAYCVLVTRGKDRFDSCEVLPGVSFAEDAAGAGLCHAAELMDGKDPIALCAGNVTVWNIISGMKPWQKESEFVGRARAAWTKMSADRAGRLRTRVFKYTQETNAMVAEARKLAYLTAFPGEIWAPEHLP